LNTGLLWSKAEVAELTKAYGQKPPHVTKAEFARHYVSVSEHTVGAIRMKLSELEGNITILESPYPRYDEPLVMEGDALILPDIEFPFHHAEFLSKCLELAAAWKIRQCIVAGDLLHFDSLSGWEPNWKKKDEGGLTDEAERKLIEFAKELSSKKQGQFMELIGNIGQKATQDGMSTEVEIARRELRRMEKQFDRIDMCLGNHEGRLLRALQTTLNPDELGRLLETGDKWRIAPYYFSYLISAGEKYLIDHPKSAAASTAAVLAAKFQANVLMGHSHHFSITTDVSGRYFAAEIGCIVDEARLPYAAQRHTRAPAHSLGAAIIRDGFPTILTRFTDWERLMQ
jgi:hypothetical protein